MEIEFKWEANQAREFVRVQQTIGKIGARIGKAAKLSLIDWYVDTPNRDFEKKQIAMRIRKTDNHFEATFKTRTEIVKGKAVRTERTCALPQAKTFAQALDLLQAKKTWNGLPIQTLQPIFVIYNKRQIQPVLFQQMVAELAFDKCQISVCGRRVFFKEIELELKKGSTKILEKLAADLTRRACLIPARVSKVKTATALLKLWEEK